jgi:hypothetical protein
MQINSRTGDFFLSRRKNALRLHAFYLRITRCIFKVCIRNKTILFKNILRSGNIPDYERNDIHI